MIDPASYDQWVTSRLDEFWSSSTSWHRRLWNLGTVAAIGELLEASESLPSSVLKDLQAEVDRLVGPDLAVGDSTVRGALTRRLKENLPFQRANWYEIKQLLSTIESGYLGRCADLLRPAKRPGVERVARSVAGHLLHSGFSTTYLHRWLRYQVQHRPETLTVADLVGEASSLVQQPNREFKVIIPILSAPGITQNPPPEWLAATQTAELIMKIQGTRTDLRQNGGFLLKVLARDQYAAVELARDLVDRWDARAELSTRDRIVRTDRAWVEGFRDTIRLLPVRRQVDIGALSRQNQIYAPLGADETSVRIDDALQLVQPMEAGPRSAAISGGWASTESLLTDGQEAEKLASPRLASIIACSFPRAELTTLAFSHAELATDGLAEALKRADGNLQRTRIIAEALSRGDPIMGRGPHDDAACDRMRELLASPRQTLERVRDYVGICLNRLYRQRNLTLHGGRVTGDGRLEALATAPPLIGAGLDRIAHAWFAERTRPIELAARAALSLELVGSPAGRHPVELLESA